MNLIEEAARRLQQLEKAGVHVPAMAGPDVRGSDPTVRLTRALVRPADERRAEPYISVPPASAENARTIDFARLQAKGFIHPGMGESQLLHELRVIKRPLIQHALGRGAVPARNRNLIMVTSALPGEGKTFVAVNLALSIAMEVDCRVLLVDADVIAPSIPALLEIEPAKGLMDFLVEPSLGFGRALLRTNVDRLSLVLAGSPQRGASELLASDAMSGLLTEISARYPDRIVIFDSPPLLSTTESRVLATHMGQVLMVVEAGKTSHGALENALATIEACPTVMTVLNRASPSDGAAYYGNSGYGR